MSLRGGLGAYRGRWWVVWVDNVTNWWVVSCRGEWGLVEWVGAYRGHWWLVGMGSGT